MNPVIKLLRPKHWIKNFLVFAAIFFSFSFTNSSIFNAINAFVAFSLLASSIYIINDIIDAPRDREHAVKKYRPIASGQVKAPTALLIHTVLLLLALIGAYYLGGKAVMIVVVYYLLNLLYSFALKNVPIIDVMIVAFGFVLRVVMGSVAIGADTSHWLLLCTFFVSLFLAFGKRKNEMGLPRTNDKLAHRVSLNEYTDRFVDQMIALTSGISVTFYSLYTIDSSTIDRFGSNRLVYTTPIVVFGIFRYYYLLYNKNQGEDPVVLFTKDKQLVISIGLWLISVLVLYFFPEISLGI